MKNLGKKFFTVLIILFFCLSPLGAIDLNQGDNSSHLNDLNDGSHLNDLNGTDIEVESVNETDVESQKLQAKNINLVMEVDDTTYGESAVVKVWFKDSGFGIAYNPKIIVEGNYISEVYTKRYFTQGYNEIKLRDDLPAGTYTATYSFTDGNYWKSKTVTDTFTVKRKNVDLNASVNDIYVGEKPVIKLESEQYLPKDVIISSPQFAKDYKANLFCGSDSCTIDEDLPAGNYTCTVSYPGDSTNEPKDITLNFAIKKYDPNLTVQVDDVTENDLVPIKIKANESVNGEVTYLIRSQSGVDPMHIVRTIKVVNGVANETLDPQLQPGIYSVSANFKGDDYFKESTALASFKVNEKPSPGLSASIDDIELGEKPVVEISSNEDLEDDVIVYLPKFSEEYNVPIQGGSGSCTLDEDLPAGNYSCNVIYHGDRKYKSENLTVNFTVNKHDSNLAAQAYDFFMGKKILVQLNANESVNGDVEYYILPYGRSGIVVVDPSMKHNATLVNGRGSDLIETDLAPGKYEIFATYNGDDSFKEVTVSSAFDVNEESNNLFNACEKILFNS